MTTVVLGNNRIENCAHVLSVGGDPLLSVGMQEGQPVVNISLTPAHDGTLVQVRDNEVVEGPLVVEHEEGCVRIVQDRLTVVHARVAGDDSIEIAIDFRQLGLNVYSEPGVLHVGGARLSGNVIGNCTTAINIA